MIQVSEKQKCCGCEACVQKCPKGCIQMQADYQGFYYPIVNQSLCIDCGLCEVVCPIIHQEKSRKPLEIYGAVNKDEKIRLESSSGGIFTAIAESLINKDGIIWGASFNESHEVIHDCITTEKQLSRLRGSKYVQSRIDLSYKKVEVALKMGEKLLFSGTPCQIAGLRRFLRKDYPNLYTVDFVCHGVPSPGVWTKYLEQQFGKEASLSDIKFRDKICGWKNSCFSLKKHLSHEIKPVLHVEQRHTNLYMRAFLHDLILRPSCYDCPARSFKSGSDITLADLWGAWVTLPEYNDDKGCSCVAINTPKGKELFNSLAHSILCRQISYRDAFVNYNHAATMNPPINPKTDTFFSQYEFVALKKLVPSLTKDTLSTKSKEVIRSILEKIGLLKIWHKLKRKC